MILIFLFLAAMFVAFIIGWCGRTWQYEIDKELFELECRVLRAAIVEHHDQKADDRCIEDDDKLYAAAVLPPCDRHVGSKEAMLANCKRFIERRCEGGKWPSYAELEKEIAVLKESRATVVDQEQLSRNEANRLRGEIAKLKL